MKPGDIVWIPFPFTNLAHSKQRPALVISTEAFNQHRNVILAAISTKYWHKDFCIHLDQNDLAEGTLLKHCCVRLQNVMTLESRLVIKKMAKIKESKLKFITKTYKDNIF